MILFRLISWPYLRRHALRTALTIVGIVFGIAVFVAMHAANESVFGAFQETIQRMAGATQLQITAGTAGFPEEVLERVQALPEVAVAAPVVEAVAGTGLAGQGSLLIVGVDMTGDRGVREYDVDSGDAAIIDDPLVFLAQPDSLMIAADFARRNGLKTNDRLPLETVDGRKEFVVRGILGGQGLAAAFGGNIAVMDIYAAEQVFGRGRKFDRIDVRLADGVTLADGQRALQSALGPGLEVQTPGSRGQSFESLLRVYSFMLRFTSIFALVIGMFIIYNSFSIAVTQRRGEIGILRALGATRGQIATLFLGESAVGGLVGSAAGVVAGFAISNTLAGRLSLFLEGIYGVNQGSAPLQWSQSLAILSIAIGTGTSIVAAALPARNAARVDPVKALQKGGAQALSAGEERIRTIVAVTAAVVGAALIVGTRSLNAFYVGYVFVLVAALMLTPVVSAWLVVALRPVLQWMRPVEGALAADSLLGSPRRTSSTVAALMLALGLLIGIGGVARAARNSITEWANQALNPDLFVTASPTLTERDYHLPDSLTPQLQAIDGIGQIQRMRQERVQYRGGLVLLLATDVGKVSTTSRRTALAGDSDDMYLRTARGEGVIGSENFAALYGVHVGDVVDLPSPSGIVRLPLVGIVRDYADQQGSVMLDLAVFRRHWNDDGLDYFRVYLRPHGDPTAVKEAILRQFSGNRRLFVLSSREAREYVANLTNQWFGLTWLQMAVAVLVAVLGIVNSLTVTIADRRRELGILRAVGALGIQVRGTIWMEAAAIAIVSVILGLAFGAVHLYCVLQISSRDFPGFRFDYTYPYGLALLVLPMMLAAAFLSSLAPAESAVRSSLVEALEYE